MSHSTHTWTSHGHARPRQLSLEYRVLLNTTRVCTVWDDTHTHIHVHTHTHTHTHTHICIYTYTCAAPGQQVDLYCSVGFNDVSVCHHAHTHALSLSHTHTHHTLDYHAHIHALSLSLTHTNIALQVIACGHVPDPTVIIVYFLYHMHAVHEICKCLHCQKIWLLYRYIYVCTHIYIYVYKYIYIYIYTHTYIYTYFIYTCMYICIIYI